METSMRRNVCYSLGLVACTSAAFAQIGQSGRPETGGPFTEALMPVELLAPKPGWAGEIIVSSGLHWDAVVIASQPARIARGVVVTEGEANKTTSTFLSMAVLGKVQTDTSGKVKLDLAPSEVVWCKPGSAQSASSRCYQDSNGDGNLDMEAEGVLPSGELLSINRIGPLRRIAPLAYRPATNDELIEVNVEYFSCRNLDDKVRYGHRIRRVKTSLLPGDERRGGCNDLAKPLPDGPAGEKQFEVGRIKVAAIQEGDKLKTRVVEAIPAGTILGHLRVDRPFTDAIACKSYRDDRSSQFGDGTSVAFSGKPTIVTEPVKPGGVLFSAPVSIGITGTLGEPLVKPGMFGAKGKELYPSGTLVFGALMNSVSASGNLDPQIVWCVPDKGVQRRKYWTECIVSSRIASNNYRFKVDTLSVSNNSDYVSSLIVNRGPVDFGGPIAVTIRFKRWNKRDADFEVAYDLESEAEKMYSLKRVLRTANGSAWLLIGSKLAEIKPAGDGSLASITMSSEIAIGEEANVEDAVPIVRKLREGK